MAHSDRLRKQQDALSRWATAFNDLLSDCRPIESFSGLATWEPRLGRDVSRKAAELERLTDPAAAALQGTRFYAEWKRPGTFRALGLLEHDFDEAAEHEQSLEGRLAAATSKPRRLWWALRGAPSETQASVSPSWQA